MVEQYLSQALEKLVKDDPELLERNVNERSMTHKLAEYLQPYFKDMHVDCEYNRDEYDPKELDFPKDDGVQKDIADTEAITIYPDIIVHRRGVSTHNLLVIEVKKSNNLTKDKVDFDKSKLRECRDQLHYQNAAFVVLKVGSNIGYTVEWV
ncbi:hypothetical protein [Spirosoma koreense]